MEVLRSAEFLVTFIQAFSVNLVLLAFINRCKATPTTFYSTIIINNKYMLAKC